MNDSVEFQKRITALKNIGKDAGSNYEKSRRIFLEEPSFSTVTKRNAEFQIKSEVSKLFAVPYGAIRFCGSAHLGVSAVKGTLFEEGISDLDLAIVSPAAFSLAFEQLSDATRGFSDTSVFVGAEFDTAERIKERIWKRGMIALDHIPKNTWAMSMRSDLEKSCEPFRNLFAKMTVAFYISEHFYCWKQKSAIDEIFKMKI
jgi:hypothetical protein